MRLHALLAVMIVAGSAAPARADFETAQASFARGEYVAAFREFERLAGKGHAGAQSRLAEMYFSGRGVERDVEAAVRWFRAAAEQGDIAAQVNFGTLLAQGGDPSNGARWFRRAAEQGDADGMTSLATLYLLGRGVDPDPERGLFWFRKAAALGSPETQLRLALLYARGVTGQPDVGAAIEWMRRAANQGYAPAQMRLGAIYAEGRGVPRDVVPAYKWFHMALMQGAEEAAPAIETLAAEMTSEQIDRAKKMAGAWSPGAN